MTNDFKFMPRATDLPDTIKAQAKSDRVGFTQIDAMLDVYSDENPSHPDKSVETNQALLHWYTQALEAYEATWDPDRTARARRIQLVREDYDRLCPDIETVGDELFAPDAQGKSLTSKRFGERPFTAVLFYSSPGCPYCVPLARKLQALTGEFDEVRFFKINSSLSPEPFARFAIRALPSLLLFHGEFSVSLYGIVVGDKSIEELRDWFMGFIAPRRQRIARESAERAAKAKTAALGAVCIDGVCELPAAGQPRSE